MSLQDVENMTLAQKRMAAMVMENTADEIEAHRARQAAAEAEAAAAVRSAGAGPGTSEDEDAAMEQSDDEDDENQRRKREDEERQREFERAKAIQASANVAGPIKVKTDYVPKRMFPLAKNMSLLTRYIKLAQRRGQHL